MKTLMLVTLFLAGLAGHTPAVAQVEPGTRDAMAITRENLQVKREEIVRTAMDLPDGEAGAFWVLYHEWRTDVVKIGDRKAQIIEQLNDQDYDRISDQRSKEMLDEWLQIQAQLLKLQKQYVERFRKILPDRKVARFFQLENKLDAIVAYDLAERLPLLE
jgi:hypothetical protein